LTKSRWLGPGRATSWLVPLALLGIAFLADALSTRDAFPASAVVISAFVASALLDAYGTAVIAGLAVAGGAILLLGFDNADASRFWSRIVFIAVCAVIAVALGIVRDRRERTFDEHRFLGMLHRMTAVLLGARTVADVADAACAQCVPLLGAKIARIALATDHRTLEVTSDAGSPPEWRERGEVVSLDESSASADVFRRNDPVFFAAVDDYLHRYAHFTQPFGSMAITSLAVVPVRATTGPIGVLLLLFETEQRFDPAQQAFIRDVADEIGSALERARLSEFESNVVATIQSTLLGPPVLVEGIGHEARYLPADRDLSVGGDWYDAQRLPDGRVSVCVGDVVGRGLPAAAVMGQLRSALAGCALDATNPAVALDRLDKFAQRIPGAMSTTVALALVDAEGERVDYASAGHLPPALVSPDGDVSFLDDAQNWPLAVADGPPRKAGTAYFPAGSTIVFFTDGLIERRGESLDTGFARLAESLQRNWALPLHMLCDTVIADLVAGNIRADDLALVVLRSPVTSPKLFLRKMRAFPEMLSPLRADLRAWLDTTGLSEEAQEGMLIAIGEACANVIEHAYGDEAGLVRVEASNLDDGVVASVCDTGAWKDRAPQGVGKGVSIMRALVDEMRIERRLSGTAVVLRCAHARDRDTAPLVG
jgi:serine phosphatase RsbU (regulator of sigma subunit)/anti-sigma regulatory factor (Ser/Thr protein kinase)